MWPPLHHLGKNHSDSAKFLQRMEDGTREDVETTLVAADCLGSISKTAIDSDLNRTYHPDSCTHVDFAPQRQLVEIRQHLRNPRLQFADLALADAGTLPMPPQLRKAHASVRLLPHTHDTASSHYLEIG